MIYSGWYAVAFWAVFGIWGIVEVSGNVCQGFSRQKQAQDRNSFAVLAAAFIVGFSCAFLFPVVLPSTMIAWEPVPMFYVGLLLMGLGGALRWYAVWILGKYFTRKVITQPDQPIVQAGPYKLIRHPAYAGSLLTTLGVGLAMTNWASMLTLLLSVFLGFLYRIYVEERALCRALGQPYRLYMQHTKRLIPFVF